MEILARKGPYIIPFSDVVPYSFVTNESADSVDSNTITRAGPGIIKSLYHLLVGAAADGDKDIAASRPILVDEDGLLTVPAIDSLALGLWSFTDPTIPVAPGPTRPEAGKSASDSDWESHSRLCSSSEDEHYDIPGGFCLPTGDPFFPLTALPLGLTKKKDGDPYSVLLWERECYHLRKGVSALLGRELQRSTHLLGGVPPVRPGCEDSAALLRLYQSLVRESNAVKIIMEIDYTSHTYEVPKSKDSIDNASHLSVLNHYLNHFLSRYKDPTFAHAANGPVVCLQRADEDLLNHPRLNQRAVALRALRYDPLAWAFAILSVLCHPCSSRAQKGREAREFDFASFEEALTAEVDKGGGDDDPGTLVKATCHSSQMSTGPSSGPTLPVVVRVKDRKDALAAASALAVVLAIVGEMRLGIPTLLTALLASGGLPHHHGGRGPDTDGAEVSVEEVARLSSYYAKLSHSANMPHISVSFIVDNDPATIDEYLLREEISDILSLWPGARGGARSGGDPADEATLQTLLLNPLLSKESTYLVPRSTTIDHANSVPGIRTVARLYSFSLDYARRTGATKASYSESPVMVVKGCDRLHNSIGGGVTLHINHFIFSIMHHCRAWGLMNASPAGSLLEDLYHINGGMHFIQHSAGSLRRLWLKGAQLRALYGSASSPSSTSSEKVPSLSALSALPPLSLITHYHYLTLFDRIAIVMADSLHYSIVLRDIMQADPDWKLFLQRKYKRFVDIAAGRGTTLISFLLHQSRHKRFVDPGSIVDRFLLSCPAANDIMGLLAAAISSGVQSLQGSSIITDMLLNKNIDTISSVAVPAVSYKSDCAGTSDAKGGLHVLGSYRAALVQAIVALYSRMNTSSFSLIPNGRDRASPEFIFLREDLTPAQIALYLYHSMVTRPIVNAINVRNIILHKSASPFRVETKQRRRHEPGPRGNQVRRTVQRGDDDLPSLFLSTRLVQPALEVAHQRMDRLLSYVFTSVGFASEADNSAAHNGANHPRDPATLLQKDPSTIRDVLYKLAQGMSSFLAFQWTSREGSADADNVEVSPNTSCSSTMSSRSAHKGETPSTASEDLPRAKGEDTPLPKLVKPGEAKRIPPAGYSDREKDALAYYYAHREVLLDTLIFIIIPKLQELTVSDSEQQRTYLNTVSQSLLLLSANMEQAQRRLAVLRQRSHSQLSLLLSLQQMMIETEARTRATLLDLLSDKGPATLGLENISARGVAGASCGLGWLRSSVEETLVKLAKQREERRNFLITEDFLRHNDGATSDRSTLGNLPATSSNPELLRGPLLRKNNNTLMPTTSQGVEGAKKSNEPQVHFKESVKASEKTLGTFNSPDDTTFSVQDDLLLKLYQSFFKHCDNWLNSGIAPAYDVIRDLADSFSYSIIDLSNSGSDKDNPIGVNIDFEALGIRNASPLRFIGGASQSKPGSKPSPGVSGDNISPRRATGGRLQYLLRQVIASVKATISDINQKTESSFFSHNITSAAASTGNGSPSRIFITPKKSRLSGDEKTGCVSSNRGEASVLRQGATPRLKDDDEQYTDISDVNNIIHQMQGEVDRLLSLIETEQRLYDTASRTLACDKEVSFRQGPSLPWQNDHDDTEPSKWISDDGIRVPGSDPEMMARYPVATRTVQALELALTREQAQRARQSSLVNKLSTELDQCRAECEQARDRLRQGEAQRAGFEDELELFGFDGGDSGLIKAKLAALAAGKAMAAGAQIALGNALAAVNAAEDDATDNEGDVRIRPMNLRAAAAARAMARQAADTADALDAMSRAQQEAQQQRELCAKRDTEIAERNALLEDKDRQMRNLMNLLDQERQTALQLRQHITVLEGNSEQSRILRKALATVVGGCNERARLQATTSSSMLPPSRGMHLAYPGTVTSGALGHTDVADSRATSRIASVAFNCGVRAAFQDHGAVSVPGQAEVRVPLAPVAMSSLSARLATSSSLEMKSISRSASKPIPISASLAESNIIRSIQGANKPILEALSTADGLDRGLQQQRVLFSEQSSVNTPSHPRPFKGIIPQSIECTYSNDFSLDAHRFPLKLKTGTDCSSSRTNTASIVDAYGNQPMPLRSSPNVSNIDNDDTSSYDHNLVAGLGSTASTVTSRSTSTCPNHAPGPRPLPTFSFETSGLSHAPGLRPFDSHNQAFNRINSIIRANQ